MRIFGYKCARDKKNWVDVEVTKESGRNLVWDLFCFLFKLACQQNAFTFAIYINIIPHIQRYYFIHVLQSKIFQDHYIYVIRLITTPVQKSHVQTSLNYISFELISSTEP